jgi:hypothetical protein
LEHFLICNFLCAIRRERSRPVRMASSSLKNHIPKN